MDDDGFLPFLVGHGRMIGAGKAGPVTKKLQKAFFDVVTGKDRKHKHWLTPVPMKKSKK